MSKTSRNLRAFSWREKICVKELTFCNSDLYHEFHYQKWLAIFLATSIAKRGWKSWLKEIIKPRDRARKNVSYMRFDIGHRQSTVPLLGPTWQVHLVLSTIYHTFQIHCGPCQLQGSSHWLFHWGWHYHRWLQVDVFASHVIFSSFYCHAEVSGFPLA